jgi:predicted amidohydrolase YtcJ
VRRARDLKLVNGKIATMDKRNTVASEVTIRNGRIQAGGAATACTKVINLHGRTAIPGIIDNHNHIVLLGMRPGHDIRLETAASIADVQTMIEARAKTVPGGAFITALGDWNIKQFAEKRLPTLAELDTAAPINPVLINGGGGTVTNSLGKAFFEGKGVMVNPPGSSPTPRSSPP